MNGFADHGLDESAFGDKGGISVKSFDAFPKTKPTYQQKTHSGGVWTVVLIVLSCLLGFSELRRWWAGHTSHTFSVEKGISHDLQINLDIVLAMKCKDVRINVQDASGDRILAGETLNRAATLWNHWSGKKAGHQLGSSQQEREKNDHSSAYEEEDVHDYLGSIRGYRAFADTPRVPRGFTPDACRVFGTLSGNKVQGDFHITARGHGYMEFGQHLDHSAFNFTHQINELSFGPFYPNLHNPLDNTRASTEEHFYKFQYYVSVVPTVYTTDSKNLELLHPRVSPGSSDEALKALQRTWALRSTNTVFTNQYAVTEQSHAVNEYAVPGVFVKYDIEPILLTIAEEWDGWLAMLVRIVNVVSGILVAGGWLFQMSDWAKEAMRKGRRRTDSFGGVLHGRSASMEEKRVYTD
ncbi:endoplasmic reticulum-golgi intermediate compartment-domain-containing protein [Elsinoe ampelina]|uniref:Endoplasmic reticulum-Golgi intermediate compartment protein n=1 Tax=Elsinoe ampelina TaxID=302913 RepID=A0A6A6G420_9PEZI|nr:endoplasmic reticulum-golgi intermediate compartment-domain-containing protein [Elsinoe ampelina]